jgi:hypothetical protein
MCHILRLHVQQPVCLSGCAFAHMPLAIYLMAACARSSTSLPSRQAFLMPSMSSLLWRGTAVRREKHSRHAYMQSA